MKNVFKKLPLFFVPFMIIGCTENVDPDNPTEQKNPEQNTDNPNKDNPTPDNPNKDDGGNKNTNPFLFDETEHWQENESGDATSVVNKAKHEMGDWTFINPSLADSNKYQDCAKIKLRKCKTCAYTESEGMKEDFPLNAVLPELRFTTSSGTSFATSPTKDTLEKPEVTGTYTLTNCDDKYKLTDVEGTMKVRGNQTAGWKKKGFRIKFDKKQSLLGLNKGGKYKKWVLFADAKDTALIRTCLGLYLSRKICSDNVWVSDFVPVSVYINNTYWGYYILAEQKEVKEGRINLPEPAENYAGADIAYCFEQDYYAINESKKSDGGDPTFSIQFKPRKMDYDIENVLAPGNVNTYTMLSEITNKTTQLGFISNRVENLYNVLYEGAKNNKPKKIDGTTVKDWTGASLETVIKEYFDIDSFAEGYIINELDCAPDVGYSSFYMKLDNTATGDKKLYFENPWDFDSNFGNRREFIVQADGNKADYLKRSSNVWLHLLGKFDFFMDVVKQKWNKLRDIGALEMSFHMMNSYFEKYDAEYQKNFAKWPTNDAAYELRDPFKNTSDYKKAEKETINWVSTRINYLEKKWGNGRANVLTTDK